jgi:START domain
MGNKLSTAYKDCCLNSSKESKPLLDTKPVSQPSFDKMPEETLELPKSMHTQNISKDLDQIYKFLINSNSQKLHKDYKEALRQYGCRVFTKDTSRGVSIKADWLTNLTGEEVISYFNDTGHRIVWDDNIEDTYIIESTKEYNFIYTLFKQKFAISQRDMVLASKVYRDDGVCLVSVSCHHSSALTGPGVVRINVHKAGIHAQSIPKDSLNNITKINCILEADFGGSVPTTIIKKIVCQSFPKLVHNLDKIYNNIE